MKLLKIKLCIICGLLSFSAYSEEKIIDQFSGTPPLPGGIRNLAWGEAPEEYIVQPGDSLFDICEQLVGDGNYWPKLWATNPEVKNPHFIHPGTKLRFFGGDLDNPPYLEVISDDEVMPINHSKIKTEELLTENIKSVELDSLRVESPAIEIIGPDQLEVNSEATDSFEFVGYLEPHKDTQVVIPGFILKEEVEALGVIRVGSEGEIAPSELSKVFFDYKTAPTSNTSYTVLRPEQKIFSPKSGDFIGYRYSYVATLLVIQIDTSESIALAKIEKQRLSSRAGDIVVPYMSTQRLISTYETTPSNAVSPAAIIGFEFNEQQIANSGHFVYLENESLTTGQFLNIFQTNGRIQNGTGSAKLPNTVFSEPIGVVQIIDTSQAAALGYIISCTREVLLGDKLSL